LRRPIIPIRIRYIATARLSARGHIKIIIPAIIARIAEIVTDARIGISF